MISAGIDEAGRGCLAGPVAAAAVILNPDKPIRGLADSKKLGPAKRERLAELVRQNALAWSVGLVWQQRIDKINILAATLEAMARAVATLRVNPEILLIDGNRTIPQDVLAGIWQKHAKGSLPQQQIIIGGDALHPAISAASIIAKTFRDRLMRVFARKWPVYNFDIHKGYGTSAHLAALQKYGPCRLHRLSFRGVCSSQVLLPL